MFYNDWRGSQQREAQLSMPAARFRAQALQE